MKKILKTISVIAIASISFLSCSKEYQPVANPNNGSGTNPLLGDLSFTLYGSDNFTADEKYVYDTFDANGIRYLSILAKQYSDSLDPTVYRTIALNIQNFNGNGDYAVGSGTSNLLTVSYNAASLHFFNQIDNLPDMMIQITNADGKNYEGTFQFDVRDINDATSIINLTNGKFKLIK